MNPAVDLECWGEIGLPGFRIRVFLEDYGGLLAAWLNGRFRRLVSDEEATAAHDLILSIGGAKALTGWRPFLAPGAAPGKNTVYHGDGSGDTPLLALNLGTKAALQMEAGRTLICTRPLQEIPLDHGALKPSLERLFSGAVGDWLGVYLAAEFALFHASAIVINDKAMVFMGPSGVGKSTLAKALEEEGFAKPADDIAPLRLENAMVWTSPERGEGQAGRWPLGGLFLLGRGPAFAFNPLRGSGRLQALFEHRWGVRMMSRDYQLRHMEILDTLPVFSLQAPEGLPGGPAEIAGALASL